MFRKKKDLQHRVAHVISTVFDPLFVMPVLMLVLLGVLYSRVEIDYFLFALVFVIDILVPGIVFVWMHHTGRVNDWDVSNWKLREQVFRVFIACHALGVLLAGIWGAFHLFEILLAMWVLLLSFLLINHVQKISVHVGVNCSLVTLLVWLVDWRFVCLYAVVLLVAWARVVEKHHSFLQVVLGFFVPLVVLSLYFLILG